MDVSRQQELFPTVNVFCNQQLLQALQTAAHRPFTDSKTLVDLQLTDDAATLAQSLPHLFPVNKRDEEDLPREQYDRLLNAIFLSKNEEPETAQHLFIENVVPPDYTDKPPKFLLNASIPNTPLSLHAFIVDLKFRWLQLSRHFVRTGLSHTSLIYLPHIFFVPGGRFRECYYWDTLWIIKGLLASDMLQSAQNATRNLLHLVRRLSFVPNGNRVYYLNRSQPPLLCEAVREIYDALSDHDDRIAWLTEAVPLLDVELHFWHSARSIAVLFPNSPHAARTLSLYGASTRQPRPESFKEDVTMAAAAVTIATRATPSGAVVDAAADLYHNLATAAESGWDFSSRWFPHAGETLRDSRASRIVPCCLNSILLRAEDTLVDFHRRLACATSGTEDACKHATLAEKYAAVARRRRRDMTDLLYNHERGFWFDFDLDANSCTDVISCAGVMPVWANCIPREWGTPHARRFVNFVTGEEAGLLHVGGIACTARQSGEQWDFPNCWPPLVDIVSEGLDALSLRFAGCGGDVAASEVASRFVRCVFRGWRHNGVVHEKYNCLSDEGLRGSGGEYAPQTGFGWTNGTALSLLRKYLAKDLQFSSRVWDDTGPKGLSKSSK